LTIVVVLGCLVAATASTTIISGLAYKVVAALACLLIVARAMNGISRTPASSLLTNHRIVTLDRNGKSLWRDGSLLARDQNVKVRHGLCGSTVTIQTCQMDHGDPEAVQVGPLHREEALKLAELLSSIALEPHWW
jgi:hypothetical protein